MYKTSSLQLPTPPTTWWIKWFIVFLSSLSVAGAQTGDEPGQALSGAVSASLQGLLHLATLGMLIVLDLNIHTHVQ